jgi:hypothetical protein
VPLEHPAQSSGPKSPLVPGRGAQTDPPVHHVEGDPREQILCVGLEGNNAVSGYTPQLRWEPVKAREVVQEEGTPDDLKRLLAEWEVLSVSDDIRAREPFSAQAAARREYSGKTEIHGYNPKAATHHPKGVGASPTAKVENAAVGAMDERELVHLLVTRRNVLVLRVLEKQPVVECSFGHSVLHSITSLPSPGLTSAPTTRGVHGGSHNPQSSYMEYRIATIAPAWQE